MKKIFIFFLLFTISSCSNKPLKQFPKEDRDYALVYVIRGDFFFDFIRIKGFEIFVDNQSNKVGSNKGNNFIYFYVKQGEHIIYSKSENNQAIKINAQAGQIIFIKQTASIGLTTLKHNLSQIGADEAKALLKNSNLGKISKTII